jgi:hypothetical protein
MDYGVRWTNVIEFVLLGLLLGVASSILSIVGLTVRGGWCESWYLLPLSFLFPIVGMLLCSGLFACFRFRVKGNAIERVFLGAIVIQKAPLSRFDRIAGKCIVFENGKQMLLFGVDTKEVERMENELRALSTAVKAVEVACRSGPNHPVALPSCCLAWQDGTVKKLAQALSDEQSFDRLGILADALEDAGCTDETLLTHLRSPEPHVCGCWALEVLLSER